MVTASSDLPEPATSADGGEDVVVSEHSAAFLVSQRAADIIEVIDPSEADPAERDSRAE